MLHGGGEHHVGVGQSPATVTGHDDDVGRVERLFRRIRVEDVAEQVPQQKHRRLLTGTKRGQLRQRVTTDFATGVAAARTQRRSEAHVEGPDDVRTPKRRQEGGRGKVLGHDAYGPFEHARVFCHIRPTDHEDHPLALFAEQPARVGEAGVAHRRALGHGAVALGERLGNHVCLAGANRQGHRRQRSQGARSKGKLHQRVSTLDDVLAQSQKENGQLLTQVSGQGHHDARAGRVVDGGGGECLQECSVEPVTVLSVEVIRTQHSANKTLPGEGTFVGESRAANGADRVGRVGALV